MSTTQRSGMDTGPDPGMDDWELRAKDAEATLDRVKEYVDHELRGVRYQDSMAAHIAAAELRAILEGDMG